MKKSLILVILVCCIGLSAYGATVGTAFSYEGRLNDVGGPANGNYDLQFTIYDSLTGGTVLAGPITNSATAVSNGLFAVTLDFGAQFDGNARWLQIAVRPGGSTGAYTYLTPRQSLLPTPYAILAGTVADGVITGAKIDSSSVQRRVTGTAPSGSFITGINQDGTVTTGVPSDSIWGLNATSAYYSGGSVGVGTASPVTKFTVSGAGGYNSPSAAAITLDNSVAGRQWEWHALDDGKIQLADYTLAATRLVLDTAGNVGIGTATPASKLTVSASAFGIEHTDGTRRLGTFLSTQGGWLGTISNDKLNFFVNNGQPSMTIDYSGNVGIGTVAPANRLTVFTSGYGIEHTDGIVRFATYMSGGAGYLGTISNHPLKFFVNGGGASMTVDTSGKVGVGTVTPAATLHVSGGTIPFDVENSSGSEMFRLQSGSPNQMYLWGDAYKTSGGTTWSVLSDRRFKQDVHKYEPGLDEILQLRPVRFHYCDNPAKHLTSDHEEVGFIAQEVREVIPDAVSEDKEGYLALKADPIHWAAINAIRELNAKLERQATEKDAKISDLEKRLAKLETLISLSGARNETSISTDSPTK